MLDFIHDIQQGNKLPSMVNDYAKALKICHSTKNETINFLAPSPSIYHHKKHCINILHYIKLLTMYVADMI